MTSIRSFSEILRDGETPAVEQERYAGIIHDETLRLTRLLDDLLDLSVLANGQVTLQDQAGNLRDVLDRSVSAAGGSDAGLTILRDGSNETIVLRTDIDRLAQVFINLISNARKYCDANNPQLRIKAAKIEDRYVVDFVDNGSGIPAGSQQMIFEKFSRISDQSKAGGAGLGLAICREIMGRLGGTIGYLPGQSGAAFRVVLPSTTILGKR